MIPDDSSDRTAIASQTSEYELHCHCLSFLSYISSVQLFAAWYFSSFSSLVRLLSFSQTEQITETQLL